MEASPPADVGRWVTAGLVAYPLVTWGLAARLAFPLLDAAFVAGLVVLLPVLAVAQLPLARDARVERIPAYVASAVTVTALGAIAVALGARRLGVAGMGLARTPLASLAIWTLALVVAGSLVVWLVYLARRRWSLSESPILRELLPQTPEEKRYFVLLALLAGFGEEVTFRGYALAVLAEQFGGGWGAAAITSTVFGLLHAYQGALGMTRAALLGFALAASVLVSGSLWPCICAHVALDLLGGLWWGRRLAG